VSPANKNRFEVQKILRDNIIAGLSAIGHTGWDVMEFANASMEKANKVILMNYLRSTRVGWQGHKYGDVSQTYKRTEEWIDEQSWQIHIICKRTASTTVASVLAEDMASDLITWFNGPAVDIFRAAGVAPLRVDAENIIIYNDDSDLYQKRAVFTIKIQVPKELALNQTNMTCDEYTFPGTYPV